MPRKGAVDPQEIIESILRYRDNIFFENGIIPGPNAQVWEDISMSLNSKMSSANVYTFLKLNKHSVWDKAGTLWPINDDTLRHDMEADSEEELKSQQKIAFDLILSAEEWNVISPRTTTYKCTEIGNNTRHSRNYDILTPGVWTPLINDYFWDNTHLPCAISFKRAKVTPGGRHFLKFSGSCVECKSVFQGSVESEPTPDESVVIRCIYSGNYSEDHEGTSKRRLTGIPLAAAISAMRKEKVAPSMYRKLRANEIMRMDDPEPSHLPTMNALRLAKSRSERNEQLHSDVLTAILISKYSTEYHDIIKDIGMDKFFVHYWSSAQLHVYRNYHENCDTPTVSIDATGSLVRKMKRPFENKSGNIFLYEVTVHDRPSKLQYSVCNMLSERHDNCSIHFWLAQWIRDGALPPKVVVCDQSVALLSAIVRAFTKFQTLGEYLEECSWVLTRPSKFTQPGCFVRCDVAHAIKQISMWEPLRKKGNRIRNLFIRSMAQIILSVDIKDVESLLISIFIVALSPYEGLDLASMEKTHCEIEKEKLKERIATGNPNIEEILLENIQCDTDGSDIPLDSNCHEDSVSQPPRWISFETWADNLVSECKLKIDMQEGDHDNLQYLPELVPMITKFLKFLPIWSSIMVPLFGFGDTPCSSSSVESSFNDLKNRVLADKQLPLQCDEFLNTHIDSLEGTMKLVAAKARNRTHQRVFTDNNINIQTSNVTAQEMIHEETHALKDKQPCSDNLLDSSAPATERQKNQRVFTDSITCDPHTSNVRIRDVILEKLQPFQNEEYFTQNENTLAETMSSSCIACSHGNFPTGAHKCTYCQLPVHILEGCSSSLAGTEEGYGEERVCTKCYLTTRDKSGELDSDCNSTLNNVNLQIFEKNMEFGSSDLTHGSRNCVQNISKVTAGNLAESCKTLTEDNRTNTCIACSDGNFPSGAHKCKFCGLPVHIFEGCSHPLDNADEGFGEERVCNACFLKDSATLEKSSTEKNALENWRGLGIPPKKRPRNSYLEPQAEYIHTDLKKVICVKTIGLLKNGNRASELKPLKLKKFSGKIVLANTCSFDSLIQLLACAFCDSKTYKEFVNKYGKGSSLWEIVKGLVERGVTSRLYRLRAEILLELSEPVELPSNIYILSAEATVTDMANKILLDHPSTVDNISCSVVSCPGTKTVKRTVITVVVNDPKVDKLENLLADSLAQKNTPCMEQHPTESRHNICKGMKSFSSTISEFHFVVEILFIPNLLNDSDISKECKLKLYEIPKTVRLNSKEYHLRGAVGYSGGRQKISVVGHYVAYAQRLNHQWEVFNDLCEKKQPGKETDMIDCQILLYTV